MAQEKGGVTVYAVLKQEKIPGRNAKDTKVFRCLYPCDTVENPDEYSVDHASGAGAGMADGVLFEGGCLWKN